MKNPEDYRYSLDDAATFPAVVTTFERFPDEWPHDTGLTAATKCFDEERGLAWIDYYRPESDQPRVRIWLTPPNIEFLKDALKFATECAARAAATLSTDADGHKAGPA